MSGFIEPVLLRAVRMIKSGGRLSRDDDQEAWDMVCQLGKDHTPLATAYVALHEEVERLRADSGRADLMRAVTLEHHEIEQVLAQALGTYPKYADDPKTFPGVLPDDLTVFVGVEDSLTLAMEAADEIKRLRTELAELKSVDRALKIETLAREKAAAESEVKRLETRIRRDRGGYGASSDGDWDAE